MFACLRVCVFACSHFCVLALTCALSLFPARVLRVCCRYCGHGAGQDFFNEVYLRDVSCRATALLMGCSSGRLRERGEFDAHGIALEYLYAGAPAVVANLWDVTDKDLDGATQRLLEVSASQHCTSYHHARRTSEYRCCHRLPATRANATHSSDACVGFACAPCCDVTAHTAIFLMRLMRVAGLVGRRD
jgi:hypothetical protein